MLMIEIEEMGALISFHMIEATGMLEFLGWNMNSEVFEAMS